MASEGVVKSRLQQMQMRFQQKQFEEREQRRLEMTAQAPASMVVSDTNVAAKMMGNGKVRQMFDDRRRGAGIDRSNPLKPLGATLGARGSSQSTTALGTTTMATSLRSTGATTTTSRKAAPMPGVVRRQVNMRRTTTTTTKTKTPTGLTSMSSSASSNNNDELVKDKVGDTVCKELSSMSLKDATGVDDRNNNNISLAQNRHELDDRVRSPNAIKLNPVVTKKSPGVVRPRPVGQPLSGSASRLRPAPVPVPAGRTTPLRQVAKSTPIKTPAKSTSAKRMSAGTATAPGRGDALPAGVGTCRFCHRNFNTERLARHEQICQKMQTTRRKIFDASKHRVKGTEAEKYAKKPPSRMLPTASKLSTNYTSAAQLTGVTTGVKKNNWRQKHEEFINAIRAAKQVKAHLARGGKLSDLPPPPPSENPDYIQCPHCLRRFNEAAAERHIPRCATMLHNKPKANVAQKKK